MCVCVSDMCKEVPYHGNAILKCMHFYILFTTVYLYNKYADSL